MELINCLESGSSGSRRFAFNGFSGRRTQAFSGVGFYDDRLNFSGAVTSLRDRIFGAGITFRFIRRVAWILPVAVCALAVPVAISMVSAHFQSFANPVGLESETEESLAFVDSKMNEFALSRDSYFDSDGNVWSASEGMVSRQISFKEPVTYTEYTVKSGDTIGGISRRFGLSNISTLVAVNNITNVRALVSGKKLTIPSADGLIHTVLENETISSVAEKYNVSVTDLLDINELSSDVLAKGTSLFIPGARMDSQSLKKAMGEVFTNPLKARYVLSSYFGPRKDPITGVNSSHTGIDMACPQGTAIYAAMSGKVTKTGFSPIYGNYVVIDHIEGYQTLYAHMSRILVAKGASVSQSTNIGLVGNTGYSTGPHLHFTVYKNHKLVDPFTVIK